MYKAWSLATEKSEYWCDSKSHIIQTNMWAISWLISWYWPSINSCVFIPLQLLLLCQALPTFPFCHHFFLPPTSSDQKAQYKHKWLHLLDCKQTGTQENLWKNNINNYCVTQTLNDDKIYNLTIKMYTTKNATIIITKSNTNNYNYKIKYT